MSLLIGTPNTNRHSLPPESDDDDNDVGNDEFPEEEEFLDEEDDDLSLHGLDDEPELDIPSASSYSAGQNMCVVCGERPPYSQGGKSYPTCGLTCAGILANGQNRSSTSSAGQNNGGYAAPSTWSGSSRGSRTPITSNASPTSRNLSRTHTATAQNNPTPLTRSRSQHFNATAPPITRSRSRHFDAPPSQYTLSSLGRMPLQSGGHTPQRNANQYTPSPHSKTPSGGGGQVVQRNPSQGGTVSQTYSRRPRYSTPLPSNPLPCVVCLVKSCPDSRFVTCGLRCAEKLCRKGPANANMCNYCHRRPKFREHRQCGDTCRIKARVACLLCKSRPKHKNYHLCGKICKQISVKYTPFLLEVPPYHDTYDMVENKFKHAWKFLNLRKPTIKRIYKIIENKSFLQPYDRYKRRVRNEAFRYHGTTRTCNLGSKGNTRICGSSGCALCSILKTSFRTSLANPAGAFGPGIYTSSASNKAYSYTNNGNGALLLTKVVLGKVKYVSGWNEVMSCPLGYNSVVYDRQNGCLNETILYSDDAIRPVFLIIF